MFKNKLLSAIFLLSFSFIASHLAFAEDGDTLLMPLDTSSDQKISLQVVVPDNFKAVDAPANSTVRIFIPNNETPDQYSEIITVSPIEGQNISASKYMEALINSVQKSAVDFKVVEQNTQKAKGIEESVAIVTYKDAQFNNRDEISIFYAASGPSGLASVQYVLAVKKDDKIDDLKQDLYDFIKNNTKFQ